MIFQQGFRCCFLCGALVSGHLLGISSLEDILDFKSYLVLDLSFIRVRTVSERDLYHYMVEVNDYLVQIQGRFVET